MKTIKKLFFKVLFCSLIISSLSFISCEESSDEADCDISALEYAQEAYFDAYSAFISNPTRSSCNNLVSQGRTLISVAEDCSDVDLSSVIDIINSSDCSAF